MISIIRCSLFIYRQKEEEEEGEGKGDEFSSNEARG